MNITVKETALRVMGAGTSKHWNTHLAKAPWLVNTTRGLPTELALPNQTCYVLWKGKMSLQCT